VADLLRLQSLAGNQAVGQLLSAGPSGAGRLPVQLQAVACPPPPAPVTPADPNADPKFKAVTTDVHEEAGRQKRHRPPATEAQEASRAAKPPTNEQMSKAQAAQVDDMSRQKPKGFDRAAFIAAVHQAIEKATPKTMQEVDDFSGSGKAGQVKGEVQDRVGKSKDESARDIKQSDEKPPDPSRQTAKPVTPMQPETAGPPPAGVDAGRGMPPPKPDDQVSLGHTKCETDSQMSEAGVTEEQVGPKANEPEFDRAMDTKKQADDHARDAPQQFRQDEQKSLADAKAGASGAATRELDAMHGVRGGALAKVGSDKDAAKGKEEAARAKVSADIEAIYQATKKDVDATLDGLDKKVGDAFDSGEKAAREAFEASYKQKKDAYFADRYSGLLGPARWLKDKLLSPPAEVNRFIDQAKQLYLDRMEKVIDQVATVVETELGAATRRIADGRKQISDYVAQQPKELRQVAQQAADNVSGKFDDLDQAVTDKSSSLVDDLAQKYVAAAKEVDDRCNAMREENKGLLEKAKDAIGGMIDTIKKLGEMLAQVAARARDVVGRILKAPIAFLGNLVSAVKQGFEQFVANIGKHLSHGLMGWLLGELADTGIEMPETFDLKGILNLVAQVLGLTWANIRARASALLGEPVVAMIEQGEELFSKVSDIFKTIRTEGLGALWHLIADKIGDLKEMVIGQIKDFVITKVITAGVTWIIGLLNPASAFIKACKAIYDIIMFFVDRGSQIMALVNAILDNLEAIVAGNIGAAANLVESVLGKAIPLVIGFLASLLGVGGISEKIKEVINAVRRPLNMAVDWLLKTVVKPIARLAMKAVGWVKGKVAAGAKWVKNKARAGFDYLKTKGTAAVDKVKGRLGIGRPKDDKGPPQTPAEREAGLARAQSELGPRVRAMTEQGTTAGAIKSFVMSQARRFGIRSVAVEGSAQSSRVVARITEAELAAGIVNDMGEQLHRDIREIASEAFRETDLAAYLQQIAQAKARGEGATKAQPREVSTSPGAEAMQERKRTKDDPRYEYMKQGGQPVTEKHQTPHPGNILVLGGGTYAELKTALSQLRAETGASDVEVMEAIQAAGRNEPPQGKVAKNQRTRKLVTKLARLIYSVEPARSQAALVHAVLAGETVRASGSRVELITELPMAGHELAKIDQPVGPAARRADIEFARPGAAVGGEAAKVGSEALTLYLQAEREAVIKYLVSEFTNKNTFKSADDMKRRVRDHLRQHLAAEVRKVSLGQAS